MWSETQRGSGIYPRPLVLLSEKPFNKGAGVLLNGLQMIGPAEAFSVELVDSFRSGGTYGEPAVLSDDLAAADGALLPAPR